MAMVKSESAQLKGVTHVGDTAAGLDRIGQISMHRIVFLSDRPWTDRWQSTSQVLSVNQSYNQLADPSSG